MNVFLVVYHQFYTLTLGLLGVGKFLPCCLPSVSTLSLWAFWVLVSYLLFVYSQFYSLTLGLLGFGELLPICLPSVLHTHLRLSGCWWVSSMLFTVSFTLSLWAFWVLVNTSSLFRPCCAFFHSECWWVSSSLFTVSSTLSLWALGFGEFLPCCLPSLRHSHSGPSGCWWVSFSLFTTCCALSLWVLVLVNIVIVVYCLLCTLVLCVLGVGVYCLLYRVTPGFWVLVSVSLVAYHLLYTLTLDPLAVGECRPRCLPPAVHSHSGPSGCWWVSSSLFTACSTLASSCNCLVQWS